jgi:hypothetical protein
MEKGWQKIIVNQKSCALRETLRRRMSNEAEDQDMDERSPGMVAYIGDEEVYLGCREVPYPLEEGDAWTNGLGDSFKVVQGEIRLLGRIAPPERHW